MIRERFSSLFLGLFLWLVLGLSGGSAQALPEQTFIITIGNNRGDASDIELLYAERDAREFSEVLRRQGNVSSDRVRLLLDENADTVRRTLLGINAGLRVQNEGQRPTTAILVFYSGHADAEALHLRGTHLPFDEIRDLVKSSPATIRLLVVDACRSGTATRVKGVRAAPEFKIDLENRVEAEGTAILTSSTADESSQESDRLRASFFSHHLVNALRGAADRNGDGRVTLSEAYDYTYAQTLLSSGRTMSIQHPTYSYDVKGSGDLVLTQVADAQRGGSRLRLSSASSYVITDEKESGNVIAEFTTLRDRALISLPRGRYFVQRRGALEYREYQLTLGPSAEVDLEQQPYRSVRYDQLVRKRGGVRRSIHGIMLMFGARGEVLSGEGVTPNLVLGYSADLPWFTISGRLRGDTASWISADGGLTTRRYELGLSLLIERYIDLPWFSLSFGILAEGNFEAQRYAEAARQTSPRNTLGLGFGALLAAERHLWAGLTLRLEAGPLALLDRRALLMNGKESGSELASAFTYWASGGVRWRF